MVNRQTVHVRARGTSSFPLTRSCLPDERVKVLDKCRQLELLTSGRSIRPSDGQEKSAVSYGFNVMKDVAF